MTEIVYSTNQQVQRLYKYIENKLALELKDYNLRLTESELQCAKRIFAIEYDNNILTATEVRDKVIARLLEDRRNSQ